MSYWTHIKNDFLEVDNQISLLQGDMLARISIDAWRGDEEEGSVIAVVMLSNHGDVLVDYRDTIAMTDMMAQNAIDEAKDQLKAHFLIFGPPKGIPEPKDDGKLKAVKLRISKDIDLNGSCDSSDLQEEELSDLERLICEDLRLNGVSCYGLTGEEVKAMTNNRSFIQELVSRMEKVMERVDGDEYRALEVLFEDRFPAMRENFRLEHLNREFYELVRILDCDNVSKDRDTLRLVTAGVTMDFITDRTGALYCHTHEEPEFRPVRDEMAQIQKGDVFLVRRHYSDDLELTEAHIAEDHVKETVYEGRNQQYVCSALTGEVCFGDALDKEITNKMAAYLHRLRNYNNN